MRWAGPLILLLATVGAVALGDIRAHPVAAAALLAVAGLGATLSLACSLPALPARIVLALLVASRAVALLGSPSLSDDIHRYIHEGRAQRLGLAVPYAVPPSALIPPPDDGTTARVNHPDVPAAYPPGAELVLLVTVWAGDALGHPRAILRLALAAADLFVLLLFYRRRRALPHAYLWYGAHPLPILEVVLGAHLDGFGIAALTAALFAGGALARGAWIGIAAHAKPIALLALLSSTRRDALKTVAAALVAMTLLALPHMIAGAPLFRGLVEYSTRWRAAPFLYALLEAPLAPFFDARAARGAYAHLHISTDPFGLLVEEQGHALFALGVARLAARPILLDASFFCRLLAGALLALALIVIARRIRDPALRIGTGLAVLWLLAPAVHPWYFLWLVPFAALSSSRALWAFSAAAPLLYQPVFAYASMGVWSEAVWPRIVVVVALGIGLALDRSFARRCRGMSAPPELSPASAP